MKKITTILLSLLLVTNVFADTFTANLKYGAKGENVVEMQEFLIDQGFLNGSATGNFYSLTLKAVRQFQAKFGLSASGFWGPLTRAKANEMVALDVSEEEKTVPSNTINIQTPVQTTPQVIYVPVQSAQAVPVVDTKAQQRQMIEDEYNAKSSQLNLKASELELLRNKIRDMAIFWNTEYSTTAQKPSLPTYISTQLQIEVMTKVFNDMLSLNRWSMDTINEITKRLNDELNVIYNEQAQIQTEKQRKISEIK